MSGTSEIVAALKHSPLTYGGMSSLFGYRSSCPWKRALEWLGTAEGQKWELRKGRHWLGGSRYCVTWRIVRSKVAA